MKDAPALVLADFLISNGYFGDPFASSPAWPLYTDFMPDGDDVQDDCAAVYDTDGIKDGRLMGTGENILHYGLQLKTRARNPNDGWAMQHAACAIIERITGAVVVVNSTSYVIKNVSQLSPSMFAGIEPGTKRRSLITTNFHATMRESSDVIPPLPPPLPTPPATLEWLVKQANYTIVPLDSWKGIINTGATGPVPLALPNWQRGLFYVIENDEDLLLSVAAQGTDFIRLGASQSAPGGNIQSTSKGDVARLVATPRTGEWAATFGYSGSWQVN